MLLVTYTCTKAQPSLCLSKDATTNEVRFPPGELAGYLHLNKYKVIFFGEQHNASFDPQVKYHLITEANRLSGIRHVFMETSISKAWHYNHTWRPEIPLISISLRMGILSGLIRCSGKGFMSIIADSRITRRSSFMV